MSVNDDYIAVLQRGRSFDLINVQRDKHHWLDQAFPIMIGLLILFFILTSICCSTSNAQVIKPADAHQAASILYAESAVDPDGWIPKLNTYYKSKPKGKTLLHNMKRVSSAYQTKSPQYRKAFLKRLNARERRIYQRILNVVNQFTPDKRWKFIHHENLKLYPSKRIALAHLKKSWGSKVDYQNCRKIGLEHYFGRCQ